MYKAQNVATSHYVYDADGKRVRRIVSGVETWQVYGIDGELVAEYAAAASATNPQKEYGYRSGQMLIAAETSPLKITWLVTDHLGTPRMNIRGTGTDGGSLASVTRHDYLPFGEELIAGIRLNGGSGQHGYEPPTDGVRQKFVGYERDNESGLDFAQARYYANVQGRFTSVDPENEGAISNDPQSWNSYAYARNNPLLYSDPDGRKFNICSPDGKECYEHTDQEFYDLKAAAGKNGYIVKGGNIYQGDQLIGTYQRTSFDDLPSFGSGVPFETARYAPAIKQGIGIAALPYVAGAGIATGGAALGVGGIGFGTTVTTLGTLGRVVVPGAAILNQLGRGDAQVFQRAINYGLSSANTFANNIAALVRGLRDVIPNGQVNKIGEIGNSPVFGSLKTGVGIAEVDGVQVVVKMVQGSPQIIGKLP